jgi:hypothetical protein
MRGGKGDHYTTSLPFGIVAGVSPWNPRGYADDKRWHFEKTEPGHTCLPSAGAENDFKFRELAAIDRTVDWIRSGKQTGGWADLPKGLELNQPAKNNRGGAEVGVTPWGYTSSPSTGQPAHLDSVFQPDQYNAYVRDLRSSPKKGDSGGRWAVSGSHGNTFGRGIEYVPHEYRGGGPAGLGERVARGNWARSAGRWIGNGAAKMSRSSCLSRSTRRRYHRAPLAPGSVICLCPLDRQSGDMSKSISKPGHRSSRRAYLRRAGMWTGQSSDHWCHPTTQSGTHLLVAVRCRTRQCWTQSRGSSGLTSETAQRIPRKCASNTMLQNNRDLGSRGRVHRPTDAATRRQREPPGRSTVLRSGRQRATRKPPLVNRNRPQHKHGFGATVQSRQPR